MHLKELEDYAWFPKILRKYQMDFIGFTVAKSKLYESLFIQTKIKQETIFDLCSGSGNPAIQLAQVSDKKVILSDKYPQDQASIKQVDILNYNFDKNYFYTVFNAFHHFDPEQQKTIVKKLQDEAADFIIVEILQPTIVNFIKISLTTTFGQLIITPFIKPFSILRIVLTYLIPINIVTVTYDGLISVLKSKSVTNYKRILYPFMQGPNPIFIDKLKSLYFNEIIVISSQNFKG